MANFMRILQLKNVSGMSEIYFPRLLSINALTSFLCHASSVSLSLIEVILGCNKWTSIYG